MRTKGQAYGIPLALVRAGVLPEAIPIKRNLHLHFTTEMNFSAC